MFESLKTAIEWAKQKHQFEMDLPERPVIDIQHGLVKLLHSACWDDIQQAFFKGWMKKLDVAKSHYTTYKTDWRLTDPKLPLSKQHYQLSLLMALRNLHEISFQGLGQPQLLKTCNVIYKILDHLGEDCQPSKDDILSYLTQIQLNYQSKSVDSSEVSQPLVTDAQVLPITVLFWEGPIARAYLETIKAMGFKVRKIIRLVSSIDLINKKPVGKLLPQTLRINYAANKQYKQIFYWPNQYKIKNTALVSSIQAEVCKQLNFGQATLKSATENLSLNFYAEKVENLMITGLKDAQLVDKLSHEKASLFLYTGGGIVPNELLAIQDKKMIHIHPGYLPEIRGADCVLWSQLTRNKLSATAFYLAPGIDVGDIILPIWLPELKLKFPQTSDNRVKYRLIYGYLDPWVRAFVLKQAIYKTHSFQQINTTKQSESEGMTFHFMHEKMKHLLFEQLV
jgi:hypothetical protein